MISVYLETVQDIDFNKLSHEQIIDRVNAAAALARIAWRSGETEKAKELDNIWQDWLNVLSDRGVGFRGLPGGCWALPAYYYLNREPHENQH